MVEDKLSMAHSLETRVPFMDNDLVDFAMNCPLTLKLNNLADVTKVNENDLVSTESKNFRRSTEGKRILRSMMRKYIPGSIIDGEKKGFSAPDSSWFRGDSIEFVKEKLKNKKSPIFDLLDFHEISNLVDEHLNGDENRRLLLWSLLNVNQFLLTHFQ